MKKYKNIFISTAVSCVMIAGSAIAQTQTGVAYPIPELGGCTDQANCKDYCGKPDSMQACVAFAEKHGMLSGEELRVSKIVAEKIAKKETPGGCATKESCGEYCQGSVDHINECVSFGETLGVIPAEELAEAKKIMTALKSGAKMPGSCKTKKECENYCSDGTNIDECLNFAEASGIIPPEELAQARKVAPFLKSGETPGACKTKAECDAFCNNDANFGECISFAEKAGFVSAEDAEMAKKVGGKGPGGCKGKDECLNFCNDEANAAECASFAKEKGLLTAEQLDNLDNGMDRLKSGLDQLPPEVKGEVVSCLENAVGGKEKLARLLAKQDVPTQAMGDKIQACFANIAQMMQAKMMGEGMNSGGGGGAPAGMPTKEELMKNIPDNVPPDMRAKIEAQIEANMPKNIPTGAGGPPTGMTPPPGVIPPPGYGAGATGGPVSATPTNVPMPPVQVIPPPATGTMPQVDCSMFQAMPSIEFCSSAPADFQDICRKCKGG